MDTIDRAGRISTDRSWSDEPCPGIYGSTRAAGAEGPHSRPQAARSIYTARPRWPESTRGARSPDQLTRFALPLNGMRFSVQTGRIESRFLRQLPDVVQECNIEGARSGPRVRRANSDQLRIAEVAAFFLPCSRDETVPSIGICARCGDAQPNARAHR